MRAPSKETAPLRRANSGRIARRETDAPQRQLDDAGDNRLPGSPRPERSMQSEPLSAPSVVPHPKDGREQY